MCRFFLAADDAAERGSGRVVSSSVQPSAKRGNLFLTEKIRNFDTRANPPVKTKFLLFLFFDWRVCAVSKFLISSTVYWKVFQPLFRDCVSSWSLFLARLSFFWCFAFFSFKSSNNPFPFFHHLLRYISHANSSLFAFYWLFGTFWAELSESDRQLWKSTLSQNPLTWNWDEYQHSSIKQTLCSSFQQQYISV